MRFGETLGKGVNKTNVLIPEFILANIHIMFRKIIPAVLVLLLLIGVYAFTITKPNTTSTATSNTTSNTTSAETSNTTYFLVRHAEKACEDCRSCGLAEDGKIRADALAQLLASKNIDRIYASECLRTQKTAQPLADKLHQSVNVYKTGDLKGFISRLKKTSDKNILVVGHSDQIPMIIHSISHKRVSISNSDFDNLFIIRKSSTGKVKTVLESTTYGANSQ